MMMPHNQNLEQHKLVLKPEVKAGILRLGRGGSRRRLSPGELPQ